MFLHDNSEVVGNLMAIGYRRGIAVGLALAVAIVVATTLVMR